MREEKIKELNDGFSLYGSYARMLNPDGYRFNKPPIEFYRDLLSLKLGGNCIASFSVCRVEKRPLIVDKSEFHSFCGEGILPLDGDILIHVAPASRKGDLPDKEIRIFRVPKGVMVILNPGVWHHAPFAYRQNVVNVLIVLPERTYANDCEVYELPEAKWVKIKEA